MSRAPSYRRRRPAAATLAVAVLAALSVLTGCVSLPTDGPVETGSDVAPPDDGLEVFAPGPAVDAGPEEIVQGFLLAAGSGLGDDFARAHEFLTAAGADSWVPTQGVTIYATDSLEITPATDTESGDVTVTVSATVAGTLDEEGSYTQATPGPPQDFTFVMVKTVDDQWRISQLDAGVLMSGVTFGQQYRSSHVYFLGTDDANRLVPDTRWVPRSGSADAVVEALLGGPSEWLRDAAFSAFPDGTSMGLDGVELEDRGATVTLSTQMLAANAARRALAQAQLEATLGELGHVGRVEMSVDGTVLTVDDAGAAIGLTPLAPRAPTVVTPDGLATVSADRLVAVDGTTRMPEGLDSIALPYGDGPGVGVVDLDTLVTLPTASTSSVPLLEPGGPMLAPSYDVEGWVWTGSTTASAEGALTAVDPVSGTTVEVQSPGLAGAAVEAIRVSREGARLAYALRTDDAVALYVAAIVRDADGTPSRVAEGVRVGQALTSVRALVWVGEAEIAVLGTTDDALTTVLVGVGGPSRQLPTVESAVALAAGDSDRELYLVTAEGLVYGRSGTGWRVLHEGVGLPAYPG